MSHFRKRSIHLQKESIWNWSGQRCVSMQFQMSFHVMTFRATDCVFGSLDHPYNEKNGTCGVDRVISGSNAIFPLFPPELQVDKAGDGTFGSWFCGKTNCC